MPSDKNMLLKEIGPPMKKTNPWKNSNKFFNKKDLMRLQYNKE